jgi:hypothetical protein
MNSAILNYCTWAIDLHPGSNTWMVSYVEPDFDGVYVSERKPSCIVSGVRNAS